MHWDGKLLPEIFGKDKVERLAVVITAENVEKLLGIPKINDGTGAAIAESILRFLHKWKMTDLVEMVCFDTTAANTGPGTGAAVLLEQNFDRDLLYLPCRHHISELLLRAVFEVNFGKTSAPTVPVFDRFAHAWKNINTSDFKTGVEDDDVLAILSAEKIEEMKVFCRNNLKEKQVRGDYKELLELCLIFLGDSVPNFKVRRPGATTHARFMGKTVYSFKIFMFRAQFSLTPRELKAFRNICIFLADVYVKYWYGCEKAIQAPNRDLILMKSIVGYHDQQTSSALIKKFRRHLWYLSEELVAFAFFDTEVSLEMKREMIVALNVQGCWQNHKRFEPGVEEFGLLAETNLCDFVSPRSQQLFDRLEIESDFLLFDPSEWNTNVKTIKQLYKFASTFKL